MLGDAVLARKCRRGCSKEGIYVIGFSFPVVPRGQARIRTQMSAAHQPRSHRQAPWPRSPKCGRELGVIK